MGRILMPQYSGRAGHKTHLCDPHAIGAISVPRVNRSRDYSWDQEAGHRHRARLCVKAGVGERTEAPWLRLGPRLPQISFEGRIAEHWELVQQVLESTVNGYGI